MQWDTPATHAKPHRHSSNFCFLIAPQQRIKHLTQVLAVRKESTFHTPWCLTAAWCTLLQRVLLQPGRGLWHSCNLPHPPWVVMPRTWECWLWPLVTLETRILAQLAIVCDLSPSPAVNFNVLGIPPENPLTGKSHVLNPVCNASASWFHAIRL